MKKANKKLSLLLVLTLIVSMFSTVVMAKTSSQDATVAMLWSEEFNNTELSFTDQFSKPGNSSVALTMNSDGTATFTGGGAVYSKSYNFQENKKYVVETKVTDVTGSSDMLIGTEKDAFFQIESAGVYYAVVDKNAGVVDFYDNAGTKTSMNHTNFGDNRLFNMYMSSKRTVTLDYIRVYTVNSEINFTVDSVTEDGVVIVASAPIKVDTAVFTATPDSGSAIDSTSVSVISMGECKYSVAFDGFAAGKTYTLSKKTLVGLDGTEITTANAPTFAIEGNAPSTGEPTVAMLWSEEFINTELSFTDQFSKPGNSSVAMTVNSDGTATFTGGGAAYSKSYNFQDNKKYVVEVKVTDVTGSSDMLIGTERDAFFQIESAGVYYTVVDKTAGKVDFYDNAGTKTSMNHTNFGDNRLFNMYMSSKRTVTLDYIRVYTVNSAINFTVDSVEGNEVVVVASAPIKAEGAVFTATADGNAIDSTSVSVVSIGDGKYSVAFEELEAGKTYTLTKKSLYGLDGTEITAANAPTFSTGAAPVENTEIYFNDFTAYKAADYTVASGMDVNVENGILTLSTGTASWKNFQFNFPEAVTASKFLVELKINSTSGSIQIGPVIGGSVVYNGTDLKAGDVFYGLIDKSNSTFALYDSTFTSKGSAAISSDSVSGFSLTAARDKTIVFDYIAVYKIPDTFDFSIVSSNRTGAVITTTEPLALSSTFTVSDGTNNITATISKAASGYNTYNLTFAQNLGYGTEYTVSADALTGVSGAISTSKTVAFTTEGYVAPTYKDIVPFFLENADSTNEYTKHYNKNNNYQMTITRAEDYTLFTSDGGVAVNTPISTNATKFYVEYDQFDYALHKDFKVYPGGYGDGIASETRNKSGKFYGVLDSAAGTYDLYYTNWSGECQLLASSTGSGQPSRLDIDVSSGVYGKVHYIAAYEATTLCIEMGEADEKGIYFKTTAPINTSSSVAMLGDVALTIRPVEGEICSYVASYPNEITAIPAGAELKLTLKYLDGTVAMQETAYEVALPATVKFYNKVLFTDEDGKVHGTVKVYNNTKNSKSFCYLVASYNKSDDSFDDVKFETITVPAYSVGTFTTAVSLPASELKNNRGFVWENLTTLCPIDCDEE